MTPTILKDNLGESKRVFSPETVRQLKTMLLGVTEDEHGTGKLAKVSGLRVYGKTGTAQKPKTDGRGYDPDKVLASFVGFVDATELGLDRRIVLYIAVDEPMVKPRWGGRLAGPVFSEVMDWAVSHLLRSEAVKKDRIITAKRNDSQKSKRT